MYMTKFSFAEATKDTTAHITLDFFQRKVTSVFDWPRAIYRDNGTHFEGVFTEKATSMGTMFELPAKAFTRWQKNDEISTSTSIILPNLHHNWPLTTLLLR